ncbi:hypothetical protein PtrEW4_007306 [Pyrenophora tritici-repentis]|nr:hypothetical protein PtrSN001A_002078 [Pyrenophora tritici-repentis]KAI1567016.1 hypothetical protein PtrEW4_007306 [Pyrenophora tritici-repentis]
MNSILPKRASSQHYPIEDERPAKRISTPAGQRLSVILDAKRSKSPASAAKISVTTESTFCNDPSHQHVEPVQHGHRAERRSGFISVLTGSRLATPRESGEEARNGSNLSVSVWSDRDRDEEKFGHVRNRRRGACGWGWKKLLLVAIVILALIVALGVGLALGLKKGGNKDEASSNKSSTSNSPANTTGGPIPAGGGAHPSPTTDSPPPPASKHTPSALPSNFPVGSYSFVVFLDTVNTGCTGNANTWTCAPKTDYYDDPQKALTVLNWKISGSSGAYKISSGGHDATFDTMFQNENLDLLDRGLDTERYRFQISRSKTVNMTGTIGNKKGDFECDYGATNMQGFLYTKMQQTYPDETIAFKGTSSPNWPFAVRVEQAVAGGAGTPSCKSSSGDDVSPKAQDAGTLCSCLYKNWTPQPK